MTVKELKVLLENVPDTHIVYFEYDGPDAHSEREAMDVIKFDDYIIITETEMGR